VSGTVVIQLLDALSAIVPVVVLTRISGQDLSSIYVRKGVRGRWFVFACVFFVVFYVFLASLPLRPDSPAHRLRPENSTLTLGRFLALSPALLLVSLSNGFEEEFLFRGLLAFPWVWSGSLAAWQGWAETTESELGERNECLGGAESKRAPCDQPDLGIERLHASVVNAV
jgi:membrane protease YdiL (CAAX protease family)